MDVYRVHLNSLNYIPLPLGNITAMVKRYHPELLDILNFNTPWLTDRALVTQRQFLDALTQPAMFLMSDYVWNRNAHASFSKLLKAHDPRHVIIHGGPAIPYRDSAFLQAHPEVDFIVHQEGEVTGMELLRQICTVHNYQQVEGISYRCGEQVCMTPVRERIADLAIVPSPYLTGEFDQLAPAVGGATIETNRGCPYGCVYCSWAGYLRKIVTQNLDTVFAELEWIASRKIPVLWFADANFGILEQDLAIAEHLCKVKERYGFPKKITLAYSNKKRRSIEISRMFITAKILNSLCLGLQTTDEETLRRANRKNLSPAYYQALRDEYTHHQLPIHIQLMSGLPGSTYQSFKQDLNKVLDEKMIPIIFTTMVLPNSPMAEPAYRQQHGIATEVFRTQDGEDIELIMATNSFSRAEYKRIQHLRGMAYFAIGYRTLKYLAYLVATEKQIGQGDFLDALLQIGQAELAKSPEDRQYPFLREIVGTVRAHVENFFERNTFLRSGGELCRAAFFYIESENRWEQFYQEIKAIIQAQYGIEASLIDTAIQVQRSIVPSRHNPLSDTLLRHDFVSYYFQNPDCGAKQSLQAFAQPVVLTVKDPKGLCASVDLVERSEHLMLPHFELDSDLWRNEPE